MSWKIPTPPKKKVIEADSKAEASRLKKQGFRQRKTKGGKYILTKKMKHWELFQEQVASFLDALGFTNLECGQSSWLGRYQIDVSAGYDGTFVVIECKSAIRLRRKKITQVLTDLVGKKTEIESAIREKYGSKFNEVKYILALEDIDIDEKDEITAKENDICIWGSNYLKTGGDLFSIIGPLAVHYVLKELGVSPKPIKDQDGGADYQIPSFRVTIGDQQIFSFYLSADKLLKLVYVFRLQPGNEDAYQRFISKSRITGHGGITEFINNGGFFKTSVVCSFERQVKFEPKSIGLLLHDQTIEFGILKIPKLHGTVWIVDGQHRIYGYAGANSEKTKCTLGIVAYQDIEKRLQARDFIDINQKQKSVDPNTLWDLLSQTDPSSLQGAITKVAKGLNSNGIFKGKINIPGKTYHKKKAAYYLTLANICNGLNDRRLLDSTGRDNLYRRNSDCTDDTRYPDSVIDHAVKVLDDYFTLLLDIAESASDWKKGFILVNNGFNILLRILVEVLKYQKGTWDKQSARVLLQDPLSEYFIENYKKIKSIRTHSSNEAGRADTALEIVRRIHQTNEEFGREFLKEADRRKKIAFEKSEPYKTLKGFEIQLRKFIEKGLSSISTNWWKERVPSDVMQRAEERLAKSESPWPWVKQEDKTLISYVDFPDYVKIINRSDNWRDVFQKTLGKDPLFVTSKLRELEGVRNEIAHSRDISAEQSTALRLYSKQLLDKISPDNHNADSDLD